MAEPVTENDNRIFSGLGDIKDVQLNLLDIIKRGLDFNGDSYGGEPLQYFDINPEWISIDSLPSLFVWCDGKETDSKVMGQSLGRPASERNIFYCSVQLAFGQLSDYENRNFVLKMAYDVEQIVRDNLNLNDIANGGGEIISVETLPQLLRVSDRVRSVQGFKVMIKYYQTSRARRASR